MPELPDPLLSEIEAFLAETGMSPTTFGTRSLKDPSLVLELRKLGRDCKWATRAKIKAFMDAERARLSSEATA